jgi:glycosyltransferase involved in cell wall biosynthesis
VARVLLLHQPVDGGVGRHVADLGRELLRAGHHLVTCGPARPGPLPPDCPHIELPLGRAVAPAADARAVRTLVSILRSVRPDLVHAHSSKAGAVARLARLGVPRLPLVYSPHGYAFAGHFERAAARRAYQLAERVLSPLTTRVLCVCHAEARLARQVGRLDRIRVVHNGVRPAPADLAVDPTMERMRRRGPVVCTLTQLRPGKGVETLLHAFAQVSSAVPSAQLAIWGDGPERGSLEALSAGLGMADRVAFLGATESPLSVMRGSDVFTLSSFAESFPYVVLEAMSVGCPVVATQVGGIGEALQAGHAGLLVPPGDSAALAGALCALLGDPRRAQALAETGKARVADHFTLARMATGIQTVYSELMPNFVDG